jgi:uncharacterized Tic20 family protein
MENVESKNIGEISEESKLWAMSAHLAIFAGFVYTPGSFVFPLIIYLLRKDEGAYVRKHAAHAVNFAIVISVLGLVQYAFSIALWFRPNFAEDAVLSILSSDLLRGPMMFLGVVIFVWTILEATMNSVRAYRLESPKYKFRVGIIKTE